MYVFNEERESICVYEFHCLNITELFKGCSLLWKVPATTQFDSASVPHLWLTEIKRTLWKAKQNKYVQDILACRAVAT